MKRSSRLSKEGIRSLLRKSFRKLYYSSTGKIIEKHIIEPYNSLSFYSFL